MIITGISIDHKTHRYPTCGDWMTWGDNIEIRMSKMNNPVSEFAVFLHESVEAFMCHKAGISEQSVTDFDLLYERERMNGLHSPEDEPGDDPRAPYRESHQIATRLEKDFVEANGMSWEEHSSIVEELL